MSQYYTDIVGEPPDPRKLAWFRWYEDLLKCRIAYCDQPRSVNYYFAQSGDDDSGDGSQASPWKTITKINSVIAASDGDIGIWLNRGDTWRTTLGITTAGKPNVTIGAYGTGSRPIITAFNVVYNSSWTADAGNAGVYYRSQANTIYWAKEDDDWARPWTKQSSIATVASNAGSWWYDATNKIIYIHKRDGTSPTASQIEATDIASDSNQYPGIHIISGSDGVLIDGLRVQGFGMSDSGLQHPYQVRSDAGGESQVLVQHCEMYGGGTHTCGLFYGSTSANTGGIMTFSKCRAGGCSYATGPTIFNFYAYGGGQEGIVDQCECIGGSLTATTDAWRGQGIYAHTSAAGTAASLAISNGLRVLSSSYPVMWGSGFGAAKAFVIGEENVAGTPAISGNQTFINCLLRVTAGNPSSRSLTSAGRVNGTWINCIFDMDFSAVTNIRFALFNGNGSAVTPTMHNCMVLFRNWPNNSSLWFEYQCRGDPGVDIRNCIIMADKCTNTVQMGIGNQAGAFDGNAYWGLLQTTDTRGFSNDLHAIKLDGRPIPYSSPRLGDQLYQSAQPYPDGVPLEYDFNFRPRNPSGQNVGPFEFVPENLQADAMLTAIAAKTANLPASPAATGDVPTAAQIKTAMEAEGGKLDTAAAHTTAMAADYQQRGVAVTLPDGVDSSTLQDIKRQTDKITTGNLIVNNKINQGTLTLYKGDSYSDDEGTAITLTEPTGSGWPTDLTDYTLALDLTKDADNPNTGDATASISTVTVSPATGTGRTITIELTAAQTATLAENPKGHLGYRWAIKATSGSNVSTLAGGGLSVLP